MTELPGSLPFRAAVGIPDTLRESQLVLVLKGKDPDRKLSQTELVLSNFLTSADAGMFAGDRVPPAQSLLQVVARESDANQVRYHWRIRGVDPGAFRILLNLLCESSRRMEALDEVTLKGASPSSGDKRLQAILASPFPGRAKDVPFELPLREYFFESHDPVIRIECQRALADEEFDQIKTMLESWDHILALGGYLDAPARQAGFFPYPGELYLVEPTVVEHLISGFDGPEETYNAVIAMAVKLHSTICPLIALEIG
jgi:hypothetical protein